MATTSMSGQEEGRAGLAHGRLDRSLGTVHIEGRAAVGEQLAGQRYASRGSVAFGLQIVGQPLE